MRHHFPFSIPFGTNQNSQDPALHLVSPSFQSLLNGPIIARTNAGIASYEAIAETGLGRFSLRRKAIPMKLPRRDGPVPPRDG
jgi:hypothetical protein